MVSQGPWSSSQIGPADQHCEHHSQEPQSDVMGCRFFLACLLLQRMPPQKDKYRKGCGSPVFICFCFFDGGKPAEKIQMGFDTKVHELWMICNTPIWRCSLLEL